MKRLQHNIEAVIRPGEEDGYVAECVEIPATLDSRPLTFPMKLIGNCFWEECY